MPVVGHKFLRVTGFSLLGLQVFLAAKAFSRKAERTLPYAFCDWRFRSHYVEMHELNVLGHLNPMVAL